MTSLAKGPDSVYSLNTLLTISRKVNSDKYVVDKYVVLSSCSVTWRQILMPNFDKYVVVVTLRVAVWHSWSKSKSWRGV